MSSSSGERGPVEVLADEFLTRCKCGEKQMASRAYRTRVRVGAPFLRSNPKFQGRLVGIPMAINNLWRSRLPVSGYILINLSASACKASASVTW